MTISQGIVGTAPLRRLSGTWQERDENTNQITLAVASGYDVATVSPGRKWGMVHLFRWSAQSE